jgi:hypothetical protein
MYRRGGEGGGAAHLGVDSAFLQMQLKQEIVDPHNLYTEKSAGGGERGGGPSRRPQRIFTNVTQPGGICT